MTFLSTLTHGGAQKRKGSKVNEGNQVEKKKKLTGWNIGENRGEHFRELITGTGILLIFNTNFNTHTHPYTMMCMPLEIQVKSDPLNGT